MAEAAPDRRRTFVPVVLVGLAAGALAAVAGSRPWVVDADAGPDPLGLVADTGEMPLAAALSLVVLACWGVVLVTRRRVRRGVAVLGLLAALGLAATVVTGWVTLDEAVLDAVAAQHAGVDDTPAVATAGWFWAAAVGALLSVAATAAAVLLAPAWPEMGGRYDAPGTAPAADPEPEDVHSLDLWKAMDEGRDPTA